MDERAPAGRHGHGQRPGFRLNPGTGSPIRTLRGSPGRPACSSGRHRIGAIRAPSAPAIDLVDRT